MALNLDPLYIVNLVLCIIIVILGYMGSKKAGDKTLLHIGIAFGLFGLSHLATILGFKDAIEGILIAIRAVAYMVVILALYRAGRKA
ncbi:MAG: hypothetical protein ISS46_02295 [Candidatus Omnitrophica bacterium]|nr:hypothetical protein [Candidatus Omnitrophota bacterium]